jgi:methyltransferase (TIGR00027 family)
MPPSDPHFPPLVSASQPSPTGRVVAVTRVTFPRPATADGDADAQSRLCTGMSSAPIGTSAMRGHLEARTRFFDAQVLSAIDAGITQVVVLGAGYDDRALRFRSPGVRFFEVDHLGTQADKRHRLARMGADVGALTLVPADFRQDDVASALGRAGHRADRPSLVLAEGLLVYLERDTVVRLLAGTAVRSAPASRLVASLAVHRRGMDSARVVARANAARPGAEAEPWLTILPAQVHLDLLSRSGWTVVEAVDDASLGTGAPPGRSLLVVAAPAAGDDHPTGGPVVPAASPVG